MLWEMIVGVLAAFGFISLLWMLVDALLCPASREKPVCAIVHMDTDALQARQTVCLLNRLRRRGQLDLRIVLIDNGLTRLMRQELEMMCEQDKILFVCDAQEWEQAAALIVSAAQER